VIKNEKQLGMTRTQLKKFKDRLGHILEEKEKVEASPLLVLEEEAILRQIVKLENQIKEYEYIWKSRMPIPILQSVEDLPSSLIKARLSLGLTQKEFAALVNLKEQQIQRYESTNYETASISRIREFVRILNLQMSSDIELPTGDLSIRDFFRKMRVVGLERNFVINRLLPPQASVKIKQIRADSLALSNIGIQVIGHIARIFNWTPHEILGRESLSIDVSNLGIVQYKTSKNANQQRLIAYSFYANYLAQIILQATTHLPIKEIPDDPFEINKEIINKYGSLTIENALRYTWDLGIPVLSIDDPGGFQGAHFRIDNRNIILLKHRTDSRATWSFSLFHELWHASQRQYDLVENVLEFEDLQYLSSGIGDLSDEEIRANKFASIVLIGKNPDRLLHQCIDEAQQDLYKLKTTVTRIANRENVPVDALSNYIAYRLQYEQGENWWGTAQNLQVRIQEIQQIAMNVLLDNVDLSRISGLDLDLLRRSLLITNDK